MRITSTIIPFRLMVALALIINAASHVQSFRCTGRDDDFRCDNGDCIWAPFKCDGDHDCADSSDESIYLCGLNCESVERGGFACSDGYCMRGSSKCNGVIDCFDGSDEDTDLCYSYQNP